LSDVRRHRISFIEFLNAAPLGWSFLHGRLEGRHELLLDVPSECARRLRDGDADAGLIPVIEYQRIPGLQVVPGIGIASREEVRSVLFVSRKPFREVETVAVDTSSRTSVALLKVLFEEFHGCRGVNMVPAPPHPTSMLAGHDAALLIGNPALQVASAGLYVYDLAREWHRFTGLPFVFAFWGVREEAAADGLTELFHEALAEGLAAVPFIAEWYSSRLPLSAPEIRRYLTSNLEYRLDATCLRGLETFFELARKHRLIGTVRPLRLLEGSVPSFGRPATTPG
jgi:chorismate dehydratase